MKNKKGQSLRWDVEGLASKMAIDVTHKIRGNALYQGLLSILPSKRVDLFFELRIKSEIFSIIRTLCVLIWQKNNGSVPSDRAVHWNDHFGLGDMVHSVWPTCEFPLVLGPSQTLWDRVSRTVKESKVKVAQLMEHNIFRVNSEDWIHAFGQRTNRPNVLVHFAEGIDFSRRSDFSWLPDGCINPQDVLTYIDFSDIYTGKPVSSATLSAIEKWGISWCCLGSGRFVEHHQPPVWLAGNRSLVFLEEYCHRFQLSTRPEPVDGWIIKASKELLKLVGFWFELYETLKVMVHIDVEEGTDRNVAQCIALDLLGGVRVGKQRSEWDYPEGKGHGYHPNHIFFSWNTRPKEALERGMNRIDHMITCGFVSHSALDGLQKQSSALRSTLEKNGARFIITLFDNVFGPDIHYSESMVRAFYKAFLDWCSEDVELGLIIKSKKPFVIDNLPDIKKRIQQIEQTGRCINLENPRSCLPVEASQVADIAVGVGISSAVIEAVIAGTRGVHCDFAGLWSHPFYQWGFDRVVFDDLERMVASIQKLKEDPSKYSEIGTYGNFLDQLDPFCDAQGGQRMGQVIHSLLQGLNDGLSREVSLEQALTDYEKKWGKDKVSRLVCHSTIED